MRLRNLLAAGAASALVVGLAGVPAHSATVPSAAGAGALVTWGDEEDINGGAAVPIPADLAGPVRSVAANTRATGVVTLDGGVRVWGSEAEEVTQAPTGITDAAAITFNNLGSGAVIHADGKISAWGNSLALSEVPTTLRARAIAIQGNTGYAVQPNGTLATWGDAPVFPPPNDLTNLVDVAATTFHGVALRADGTVATWGAPLPGLLDVPDFGGKKAVKVAAGGQLSGVVFEDGTIAVWGFMPPAGAPEFDGSSPAEKVVSLGLGANVAAVTADGAVHTWGPNTLVTTIPETLDGQPVSAVAMGVTHAAAIITSFRDVTKPTIAGTPKVGQTLTATPATFSLTPDTVAGQWYAGSDPIAGKTATTLALDTSLVGKTVSYRTTANRGGQDIVSASAATAPVTPVTIPQPPQAKSKVSGKGKATGKTKKIAKKVTIAITVKTAKGVSPAGKVTVTLKGKTKKKVTVKVNAKGKATATFKKVKRGKYTATLKYTGNTKVAASTGKAKFKA